MFDLWPSLSSLNLHSSRQWNPIRTCYTPLSLLRASTSSLKLQPKVVPVVFWNGYICHPFFSEISNMDQKLLSVTNVNLVTSNLVYFVRGNDSFDLMRSIFKSTYPYHFTLKFEAKRMHIHFLSLFYCGV